MALPPIILDTDKTTPIYELPLKIRQGDTNDELQVTLGKSFEKYTDLTDVDIELIAETPDQRLVKTAVTDKSGTMFKIKFVNEMYAKPGVFRKMYFKVGDDSTSDIKLVVLQGIGSSSDTGNYIDDFEKLLEQAQSYVYALKNIADTGNLTIDRKVTELTGKMQSFVDQASEDLSAAKSAWNEFQKNSETAASDQRDGFDTTFNKLISDDKATFKTISDEFNTAVSNAKSQNTANQTAFESAEAKRASDFKTQSDGFNTSATSQRNGFETRFKSYLDKLQSDYDSFKLALTTDVSDLNNQLKNAGTDISALDTKANEISEKLQNVDLSQMATNEANITKLQDDVKSNTDKFASYTTTTDLNSRLATYVPLTKLANYSTTAEVDSKISTGVGQAKTYAEQSIKDIIGAAPATLDTIEELADAVTKNKDGVQAINDGITKKADKTELANYESKAEVISQTDYEAKKTAGTLEDKFYIVTDDTEAS